MTRALAIEALAVRQVRNLACVDLAFGPRFNIISGENGQGKTNLLEALYVLATSRSFRSDKVGELIGHGEEFASVRASIREQGDVRQQSIGLKPGLRTVRIDGKRPATLASYAVATPVVVFHPGVLALSTGGGSERRRLLDRVGLYIGPGSLHHVESYGRAQRARQRALDTRGERARDLDHWEELMVRHGSAVMQARRQAAERLAEIAVGAFARMGAAGAGLEVHYLPGAPSSSGDFLEQLALRRAADVRRGGTTVGPHRDDLGLRIGGHAVRGVASQGQHRALVLALKLAEIAAVAVARSVRPILLLDDVSSELDRERTARLFELLHEQQGQVFLTTTRRELIDIGAGREAAERVDFFVEAGRVTSGRG